MYPIQTQLNSLIDPFIDSLSFTPLNKGKVRNKESPVDEPAPSKRPRTDKENQSSPTPKKVHSLDNIDIYMSY